MSSDSEIIKTLSDSELMEYINLRKAVIAQLTKSEVMKIIKIEYELEKLGNKLILIKKKRDGTIMSLKEHHAKKKNNGYLWVTINSKPSIKFEDFRKKIEKIVTKTCFTNALYVYEQRGTSASNRGKGFHAHILFKRNLKYKPCKCIDNLSKSLQGIVGNVKSQNQFNRQVIGEDFASDKIKYIVGQNKEGEGKDLKQLQDIPWREENNLKEMYCQGSVFPFMEIQKE